MNGDEDLGEDITMKGDKFHFIQRPQRLTQFATGMNGDEDLGEDITMKGDKFHFAQNLAQADPGTGAAVVYDTKGYGANGGVEKLSFFDPKITKAHTSFYAQFATGMNGDEDLGEDITMKGDKFHFNQFAQARADPGTGAAVVYDTKGYGPNGGVEKLSFFDPKITKAHTSFYAQAEPEGDAAPAKKVAAPEPEKVQVLDPKIAKAHTTFYNNRRSLMQEDPAPTAQPTASAEPEKVQILDPKIAKAHTTFYH